jgi:hypothetical protein
MRRWFGLVDDPTAAGSTLDILKAMPGAAAAIAVPNFFVPVTTSQVDPGPDDQNRDNEVRGRRGNTAPRSFRQNPSVTFEARAYPALIRKIVPKAFSGAIGAPVGVAPASISSTTGPLATGDLKALIAWLVREDQLDRLTGCVVSEFELAFTIDDEGTISATMPGLYHQVDDTDAAEDPNGHAAAALPVPDYETSADDDADTFMLRDAAAFGGSGLVEFVNFAGFSVTFNNGLIDESRSRFRPNHNILRVVDDEGDTHKVWFPARHKPGAQLVTGHIDFSDVDAAQENKRIIRQAEKLVFEVAAGPLGTVPDADEMLRLTIHKKVFTGGGADPIQREGDQVAGFDFAGYVDPSTGKDIEATFVGTAALAP